MCKKVNRILCFFLLLFSVSETVAQAEVQGSVYDFDSKQVLMYCNVYVEIGDSVIGTQTNMEGFFSFELPKGEHLLQLSYIGFYDQEVPVQVETSTIELPPIYLNSGVAKIPQPGIELPEIYGHWKIKKASVNGKVVKPNNRDKESKQSGLFFREMDIEGVGKYGYHDNCNSHGALYFRHSGAGEIEIAEGLMMMTLIGCRDGRLGSVYSHDVMKHLVENYAVEFNSKDKMTITGDEVVVVCKRVVK